MEMLQRMDAVVEVRCSLLRELKEAVKYMSDEIRTLKEINERQRGHISKLNLENVELAKEVNVLRKQVEKDEATISRRARRLQILDAANSKLNIQRQVFVSKIQCLNCDVKALEASKRALAADCRNLSETLVQQNELICSLNRENEQLFKKIDHVRSCNGSARPYTAQHDTASPRTTQHSPTPPTISQHSPVRARKTQHSPKRLTTALHHPKAPSIAQHSRTRPTTFDHCPVRPGKAQLSPALPRTAQHRPTPPSMKQHYPGPPSTAQHCLPHPSISPFGQAMPSTPQQSRA